MTDLWGSAMAFKYPNHLTLLPMYPETAVMCIYCPEDAWEVPLGLHP